MEYIQELRDRKFWLIIGLFAIVAVLEFSTPSAYVFGYLYIGPILLVNARFGRTATFRTTAIACFLTMVNVWFPSPEIIQAPTVASRSIAVLALVVTGFLSDRNRSYQQMVLQQAKLQTQEKLASVREGFVVSFLG